MGVRYSRAMRLLDILTQSRVTTSLSATGKAEAIAQIAGLFARGDAGLSEDEVRRVLDQREHVASTGVGSGVAIPHGRLASLQSMQAGLAVARDGVDFDAIDGEPVRIFFAVLAPEKHTGDHLKALARASRLLRDKSVRDRILAAKTPADVLQIVGDEDGRP